MQELPLSTTFRAHARVRVELPDDAELEELLGRVFEEGRAGWPALHLPAESFIRHLAERLPMDRAGKPLADVLKRLRLTDLYLACACVHDVPAAISTFETEYLEKLPELLSYLKQLPAALDEICQQLRVRLLLRAGQQPPRIAEYEGRGTLVSWLRVSATRLFLKLRAAAGEEEEEDDIAALEALPVPGDDLEVDLIKRRYRAEFLQVVRESFLELTADERHLLRLYYVDRLLTPELGRLFRVSQATVSRWLKSARQKIYHQTKLRLQERLGLSTRDFESLLVVVDSQLDLRISQVLGEQD